MWETYIGIRNFFLLIINHGKRRRKKKEINSLDVLFFFCVDLNRKYCSLLSLLVHRSCCIMLMASNSRELCLHSWTSSCRPLVLFLLLLFQRLHKTIHSLHTKKARGNTRSLNKWLARKLISRRKKLIVCRDEAEYFESRSSSTTMCCSTVNLRRFWAHIHHLFCLQKKIPTNAESARETEDRKKSIK